MQHTWISLVVVESILTQTPNSHHPDHIKAHVSNSLKFLRWNFSECGNRFPIFKMKSNITQLH